MAQFASDISRMGLQFDKYLEHLKKTVEEIRTEWRPQAEKNVKIGLILTKIAEMEKVSADPAAVETEVKTHHGALPGRARRARPRVCVYNPLGHEGVFKFLEGENK